MVSAYRHSQSDLKALSGSGEGDSRDHRLPVIARNVDIRQPHQILGHQHLRGQLIYADRSEMIVATRTRRWLVTPAYGVWIAPGDWHAVLGPSGVSYGTAFVQREASTDVFRQSGVYRVPASFRRLLAEAAEHDRSEPALAPDRTLTTSLLAAVRGLPSSDFCISLPHHRQLRNIAERLLQQPDQSLGVREISQLSGLSERHVLRLFRDETGFSFRQWRERLLVTLALGRMAEGQSLTRISQDLGYNSQASFCTLFRRVTGTSPSRFRP